jgi:hypothetical protein
VACLLHLGKNNVRAMMMMMMMMMMKNDAMHVDATTSQDLEQLSASFAASYWYLRSP